MTTASGTGTDDTELVINWGLGVDSSAYLVKMLENPPAHGVDLARTMVIHQITGSEWPNTYDHAEQHVLPLLRKRRVRLVQVARAGRALEIVVMNDSRRPERIVRRGPWTLEEDEYEANGTVPQQGGIRLCSLHAKGEVGDALIAQEIDGRPFRQVMGFNADEIPRSLRDRGASKNPLRQGVYPLVSVARSSSQDPQDEPTCAAGWPAASTRRSPSRVKHCQVRGNFTQHEDPSPKVMKRPLPVKSLEGSRGADSCARPP